jgi:hypothetical protein
MHQLQYLTQSNFDAALAASRTYESQFLTLGSGEVVAAPTRTEGSYRQAEQGLLALFNSLSDAAFTELLAVAWTGRAAISNGGGDFSAHMELAVSDVKRDSTARSYLLSKGLSLRSYLENGLRRSGATFLRTF